VPQSGAEKSAGRRTQGPLSHWGLLPCVHDLFIIEQNMITLARDFSPTGATGEIFYTREFKPLQTR
jgi:hypothetical protein